MSTVRGVVPPKQRRSRETVAKILRAAEELTADRPFRDITVQDLCLAAEVSPSSFYARFPAKEDVLTALFELHADEARDDAAAAIGEVVGRAGSVRDIVRALLGAYLRFVRRNGPVMISIFSEPALTERYWSLGTEISDDVRVLVGELFGVPDQEDFAMRVEFAARVATASIVRAVGVPIHFGERMGLDDEQLLDELSAMITLYLGDAAAGPLGQAGSPDQD